MSHNVFYVNDDYPLSTDVLAPDGATPASPVGMTIDIINQSTGEEVVSNAAGSVDEGVATYHILSGSTVSSTPGRYVGYMRVQITSGSARTIAVPFHVLSKTSYLAVDRWQRKIADAAPSLDHMSDEHGRDWIDEAVDYINGTFFDTGYTSTLASITPTPSGNDLEMIAQVASLLARTAWWAGKGTWRDEEMSFNATPFAEEWRMLNERLQKVAGSRVYSSVQHYNIDKVFYDGVKLDSPRYWERLPSAPEPVTNLPV